MVPPFSYSRSCLAGVTLGLLWPLLALAQDSSIVLDGTLPGTVMEELEADVDDNFSLGVDQGNLSGNNLFFSFLRFRVGAGDSATFDGPASVGNILARVTGGDASYIGGTLRSNIPGASLYLMNPNGVIFGPNATLEIDGAFRATTADVLEFGDGGEFHARFPERDTALSMADVSAFGFLTDAPGQITVDGSQLRTGVARPQAEIVVDFGQPFALVGGDMLIRGGEEGYISTGGGRVDLASVGGPARVRIVPPVGEMPGDLEIETDASLGNILFSDGAQLVTGSGRPDAPGNAAPGSGDVFVRAHDLTLDDAVIRAITTTGSPGGRIDIDLEGDFYARSVGGLAAGLVAGSGLVIGDRDAPFASSDTRTASIPFPVGPFRIITYFDADGAVVRYEHFGALPGPGGVIALSAENVTLDGGARLSSSGFFRGSGGLIDVDARETLLISGIETDGDVGGLFANAEGGGDAGSIDVDARHIRILDGAGIFTEVREGDGMGGDIDVDASTIVLRGGARIDASTRGGGIGGTVDVIATESILVDGARPDDRPTSGIQTFSFAEAPGNAGTVRVEAPLLRIENGAVIATSSFGLGDAGDIDIRGNRIELRDGAITAVAEGAAGGNIFINAGPIVVGPSGNLIIDKPDGVASGEWLLLDESEISTSVLGGDEGGGDIAIDPEFVVLSQSRILAQAVGGPGGNIAIVAETFVSDLESVIDASSQFSTSGTVEISSSSQDLRGDLARLPTSIPDVVSLLRERCAARRGGGGGGASLVLAGRDGMPASPEDFLPAYHQFEEGAAPEVASVTLARESEPVGLLLGCSAGSG